MASYQGNWCLTIACHPSNAVRVTVVFFFLWHLIWTIYITSSGGMYSTYSFNGYQGSAGFTLDYCRFGL